MVSKNLKKYKVTLLEPVIKIQTAIVEAESKERAIVEAHSRNQWEMQGYREDEEFGDFEVELVEND